MCMDLNVCDLNALIEVVVLTVLIFYSIYLFICFALSLLFNIINFIVVYCYY